MIDSITIDGKVVTREEIVKQHQCFETFILENISENDIRRYAWRILDMIDEDDCDCEECDKMDIDDFSDKEFQINARERGFILFKNVTIVDAMRLEKIKEAFEL